MKRCPACQATYPDDAPDFCSNDGMRLMKQEPPQFDPEKTVLALGARGSEPAAPPPPAPQPAQPPPAPAAAPPAPAAAQQQPQSNTPQQQWQPQAGSQPAQAGWPPPPQPAPQWGGPFQPLPQVPQHGAAFPPAVTGKSRAIAIAALVFGVDAVTILALRAANSMDFLYVMMLVLSILGILLGATALFLALRKSYRFAGTELAIAGLALGVTGLVYTLLTW